MKLLVLVILTCYSFKSLSQTSFPVDSSLGNIPSYFDSVSVTGTSKLELFKRANKWCIKNLVNTDSNNILYILDTVKNRVIHSGYIKLVVGKKKDTVLTDFVVIISVANGKYKYEVSKKLGNEGGMFGMLMH